MSFKERFSLVGKNVLITGGAGILGSKICEGLAEYGANVIILDLKIEDANNLVNKLNQTYKTNSSAFFVDLFDEDSINKAIDEAILKYGEIHVLHNNACYRPSQMDEYFKSFEEYSLSEWKKAMTINIDAMFLVAKKIGSHMVEKKIKGSIIQTCSIYGVVAPDQRIYEGSFYYNRAINTPAVYSASKAAVVGLTQYLATYWGEKGIRVNTITPGGVQSGQNETFVNRYSNRVPLGRMGTAEELVGAIIYMASDASTYMTGQNMIIDGGLTVW